ncbi:MAG TPA: DinB family protein [Gemmatimonadales bacterium]
MTEVAEATEATGLNQWIRGVLMRDLRGLKRELEAYPDEADMWKVMPGTTNSAGNLALHLVGNMRHFIGAQLGHSSYTRDRDGEFATKNMPRAELLKLIDMAIIGVDHTMPAVDEATLRSPYPQKIVEMTVTTADWLLHLIAHLGYHLGQIDYHRRIVTGQAGAPGVISVLELTTATR